MKKTAQQIAGERVLSRVMEEVDGVSFSFRLVCSVEGSSLSHSLASYSVCATPSTTQNVTQPQFDC